MEFDELGEGVEDTGAPATGGEDLLFGFTEEEEKEMKSLKDSVLFLVDCRESMILDNKHNQSSVSNVNEVLRALSSFMKTKIITSDNDRIGLILYSTRLTKNSLNFNNIYVLQSLEEPDAARIKDIEGIVSKNEFKQVYGHSHAETPLFEALTICHNEFKSIEKLSFTKRIFIFTDNDNPNAGNRTDQRRAIQRAHDLGELNVTIELFPMPSPTLDSYEFDMKKFYADLISIDESEINQFFEREATHSRFEELVKRIRQKEFRKRVLGKTVFHLCPQMKVGVSVYNLLQTAKKPPASFMDARVNKPLKSVTKWICEETGTILYDNQIGNFFPFGGEKIMISKDEMKQIKKFDQQGLKLMGFKPKSSLKDTHNIRSSYFIYPDDIKFPGSSQVFDAMIKELIRKEKVAIVRFIPRETAIVRFCALLPQEESFDEDGFQTPPGFNVIFLPFSDDMRTLNNVIDTDQAKPDHNQIKHAKLLIKNLKIDFDPRNFENPDIQNFYSNLQGLALGEEQPEEVHDVLEPDVEGMRKFEAVFEKFRECFDVPLTIPTNPPKAPKGEGSRPPPKKRTAAQKSVGVAKATMGAHDTKGGKGKIPLKREEEEEVGEGGYDLKDDDADLRDDFSTGAIKSNTIAQLKEFLQERGLSTKGKKDVLISTLKSYLGL